MSSKGALPSDAELMPAKNRRFEETVVFVHHFGGSRRTVLRHARLLNDLGYDCVRFDLIFHKDRPQAKLPITGDLKFGIRHVWADQITALLNAIKGPKILYTFSMPSSSAFQAIAQRGNHDVKAIVCDGGPFLQMHKCIWNLYEHEYKVKSLALRAGFTGTSMIFWGIGFKSHAREFLKKIPNGFPVLSIRGWQDKLVPVSAIDEFYELTDRIDLETLALPEAGHLMGLRDFPDEYIPRVEKFLKRVSTEVSTQAAADLK